MCATYQTGGWDVLALRDRGVDRPRGPAAELLLLLRIAFLMLANPLSLECDF
jgi:hypothetical protein